MNKICSEGQYVRRAYTRTNPRGGPKIYVPAACVTYKSACGESEILRVEYKKRPYTRTTKTGKAVKVKSTKVPAGCIKDEGKKGRGKKIIKLSENGFSLRDFGYSTSLDDKTRRSTLVRAAKKEGKDRVISRLNKLAILNGSRPIYRVFVNDAKYLSKI